LLTKKLTQSRYTKHIAGFKIHDLWDRYGPPIVTDLRKVGAKTVWLDLKLHDTPKTVRFRSLAARRGGADILSVHAGSGVRGVQAAVSSGLKIVAITVLTSLDKKEVQKIYGSSSAKTVQRLMVVATKAKVWGLVCSAEELDALPQERNMKIIVPGIQLKKKSGANQKRTGTPRAVLALDADYLVLGSAVTKTGNPLATFERLATKL